VKCIKSRPHWSRRWRQKVDGDIFCRRRLWRQCERAIMMMMMMMIVVVMFLCSTFVWKLQVNFVPLYNYLNDISIIKQLFNRDFAW